MKQAHMNGTRMPHLTPCYDQNLISQYEFYFMIMMYHNIVIFTEKRVLQYIFTIH